MSCKILKKCCSVIVFAAMAGGVYYFLKSKDCYGREKGELLAEEIMEKKEKMKKACGCVKEQTKDIASEVKFAAQYSAEEMKDGWKNAAEAVKTAAENIRDDMGEMKEASASVIEGQDM